jgi:predicted metalloprotease
MRLGGERESLNVEDRRGFGGRGLAIGGGGLGVLVLALIIMLCGGDPRFLFQDGNPTQPGPQQGRQEPYKGSPREEEQKRFVARVLATTEDVWGDIFTKRGVRYREPKLVIFRDQTQTACGRGQAAVGPFYCSADETIYIDLSFFDELESRFGAAGDFAQAYVIAHEVGHHVQNLLGTMSKVNSLQQRSSEERANDLSVRLELQADFYAGLWARNTQEMKNILDPDDIPEALRAANAIGDDRLQRQSQGYVVPESFTHGTSEQRMRWFRKGWDTGDIRQGDTFNTPSP